MKNTFQQSSGRCTRKICFSKLEMHVQSNSAATRVRAGCRYSEAMPVQKRYQISARDLFFANFDNVFRSLFLVFFRLLIVSDLLEIQNSLTSGKCLEFSAIPTNSMKISAKNNRFQRKCNKCLPNGILKMTSPN